MTLKQIRVDTIKNIVTNCYIIIDNNESMVVDPGGEPEKIIEIIETLKIIPKYILLTHCHADHIGGVQVLKEKYNSKVLISKEDSKGVNNPFRNLAPFVGANFKKIEVDSEINDKDLIHIGNLEFNVISTPGHTSGGICIYSEAEKIIFSGDTLFCGALGRTDLPTSSYKDIINSVKNKLFLLPDETIVYPGHGRPTTIGEEKNNYDGF
ncbi:MAG: MBL fold metallo-hydrolase [Clostridia bacterium]|nr:MBL fold metallo-hydrolase [Clostridia bacterium]